MSISPRADGWPTDSGPLHTLHELGLHDDLEFHPRWLHHAYSDTYNGVQNFHGSTNFLSNEPLRALAAISLEGYQVFVDPDEAGLRIKIIPGRGRP